MMHGRTNVTTLRIDEFVKSHKASAISTYPTPGNRIFPPTMWSEITDHTEGVKYPEQNIVCASALLVLT